MKYLVVKLLIWTSKLGWQLIHYSDKLRNYVLMARTKRLRRRWKQRSYRFSGSRSRHDDTSASSADNLNDNKTPSQPGSVHFFLIQHQDKEACCDICSFEGNSDELLVKKTPNWKSAEKKVKCRFRDFCYLFKGWEQIKKKSKCFDIRVANVQTWTNIYLWVSKNKRFSRNASFFVRGVQKW